MTEKYKIRRFKEKHKEGVINLLSSEWRYTKVYFEWKYEHNPYVEYPICYVALYKDEVVGFRGFFGVDIRINNKNNNILHVADGFIDKGHRRKKLFSRLNEYAITDLKENSNFRLVFSLSSNKYSTPVYLKQGWISVSEKRILFQRNISGYTFNIGAGKRSIRNITSTLNKIYSQLFRYRITNTNGSKKGRILITKKVLSLQMSKLNSQIIPPKRFRQHKSKQYFDWRLANPQSDFIMAYFFKDKSHLSSYAIFKKIGNEYLLVDYCYEDNTDFGNLINSFSRRTVNGFIRTSGFGKNKSQLSDLKKAGFFEPNLLGKLMPERYAFFNPNLPYLMISTSNDEEPWLFEGTDFRENNNWDLFLLDDDGI